jgi:arylformamidase
MYRDFDLKTLEQEYSPSSCIEDIGIYINEYIGKSQQVLKQAQLDNTVITDLSYAPSNDSDQRLDLFLPSANSELKGKLQVYIHGGYWQELSKNESCFAANNFQQHGYHFAVVNYSLAPKATLAEIVEQNRQALIWLYQHADKYGYNKDQIYISGSSAGAHLAVLMAMTDWSKYLNINTNLVKGICAVSGIYDLTPIAQTYINKPLNLQAEDIAKFSPLLSTKQWQFLHTCSLIFAFGDNETSEFKRQTLTLIKQLKQQGYNSTWAEINERNHFNIILDLQQPNTWLCQQVFKQMS